MAISSRERWSAARRRLTISSGGAAWPCLPSCPSWRGRYGTDRKRERALRNDRIFGIMTEKPEAKKPIRVLLLDDREDNLILRSAILPRPGYEAAPSASAEHPEPTLPNLTSA